MLVIIHTIWLLVGIVQRGGLTPVFHLTYEPWTVIVLAMFDWPAIYICSWLEQLWPQGFTGFLPFVVAGVLIYSQWIIIGELLHLFWRQRRRSI